jgi:predicted Rossmann fold nucleotide-binding protein DprA/Smf involved in DNA uptake
MKKPDIQITGDASILNRPKVALFCSVKCPGRLILETYDLAKRFRNEGILVISGFHSPMEQECLRILLRSPHPVIWCLARGMYRRVPAAPVDCRPAVDDGRLVMVSSFPEQVRHVTAKTAMTRNRLVADMADAVVVAHATRGGKMDTLCREILASGKPLYTFEHPANELLLRDGARPIAELHACSLGGIG